MGRIFCIGMHKTGTTSLANAMRKLGYRVKHGYKKQSDLIVQSLKDGEKPLLYLEKRYGEHDFYSDLYALRDHFVVLDNEYPGSKFILTTRNEDDWLESVENQMNKRLNSPNFHYWYFQNKLQWRYRKRMHEEVVKDYFSDRDNLLVMNITEGDGYDVLCPFLGVEKLKEEFPHKNKS